MESDVQFARVEAFSYKEVNRIIGEASRAPQFCRHVPMPEEPGWMLGSADAVVERVNAFMALPCTYTQRNGQKAFRKRRNDFRCVVAGVCSWPLDMERYRSLRRNDPDTWWRERSRIVVWLMATKAWLERLYGDRLAAMLVHRDESHPHVHYFVVGDARELHPGLRAEYIDGTRIASVQERSARYRIEMRAFLDRYHAEVGAPLGLARRLGNTPKPRIKDRQLALRVLDLERRLDDREDIEVRAEIEQIRQDAPKYVRPQMRF
jgi:hypothetical protein